MNLRSPVPESTCWCVKEVVARLTKLKDSQYYVCAENVHMCTFSAYLVIFGPHSLQVT